MSYFNSSDKEKIIEGALKAFLEKPSETTMPLSFSRMDRVLKSPNVTYARGSAYADGKRNETSEFASCCIFEDATQLCQKCQFTKTAEDLDFLDSGCTFSSGAGKEQIFRDQAARECEMELTLQLNDRNRTEFSSWTPCSRKKTHAIQLRPGFTDLRQRQCVSVSEYMGAASEPIRSLSDDTMDTTEVPLFEQITSTPRNRKSRRSASLSSILNAETEVFSDFSKLYIEEKESKARNALLSLKPAFSLTPSKAREKHENDFNFYIENTAYKNLNRLKAEERVKQQNGKRKLLFSSFEDKTIQYGSSDSCLNDDQDKAQLWTVQPELIILDSRKKNRVLIVNNSQLSLKFKSKFDVKILSVSPQFGTVLPMSQIGLRIIISQCAKKLSDNYEDDIKIIVGKSCKSVRVKIISEQVSRPTKGRTFLLF